MLQSLTTGADKNVLFQLATRMVQIWKTNKYQYQELEDMFLINMTHNQDQELLARELAHSLNDTRYYDE